MPVRTAQGKTYHFDDGISQQEIDQFWKDNGITPDPMPEVPKPTGEPPRKRTPLEQQSLGGFATNVYNGIAKTAKDVGSMLLGAGGNAVSNMIGIATTNPVKTVENAVNGAGDTWNNLGFTLEAMKNNYKQYYGPLVNGDFKTFEENVYDDPTQIMSDAATVATLGEGAVLGLGKGAKAVGAVSAANKAQKTAKVLGNTAAWVDPMTMPLKGSQLLYRGATKIKGPIGQAFEQYPKNLVSNTFMDYVPEGQLNTQQKQAAAQRAANSSADMVLKHDAPINKKGLKRVNQATSSIDTARKEAVTSLPPAKTAAEKVSPIIEPKAQQLLQNNQDAVGTLYKKYESAIDGEIGAEKQGARADIKRNKNGTPMIDPSTKKPFFDPNKADPVQARQFDSSDIYQGSDGNWYHEAMKNPQEMLDSISAGNRQIRELYDDISKHGDIPGAKANKETIKAAVEGYRERLNDIIGDVTVDIPTVDGVQTVPFRELGIEESKLLPTGDAINNIIRENMLRNHLNMNTLTNPKAFANFVSAVFKTPSVKSKLALVLNGANRTFPKTRLASEAGHAYDMTNPRPQEEAPAQQTAPADKYNIYSAPAPATAPPPQVVDKYNIYK